MSTGAEVRRPAQAGAAFGGPGPLPAGAFRRPGPVVGSRRQAGRAGAGRRGRSPGRRLAAAVRPVTRPSHASHAARRFRFGQPLWDAVGRRPWAVIASVAACAAAGTFTLGGPVAGALAAVYGGGGASLGLRQRQAARHARAAAATLDTVAEMAAELRAGAAPVSVMGAAAPVLAATPVERAAVLAAYEVSERAGAPLADVLDRVEAHLRQANRLRLSVAAHRAGTRATALLLMVLPVAGIGVGFGIGVDPLRMLFHSVPGAVCVAVAGVLQAGGLWWTERLARVEA